MNKATQAAYDKAQQSIGDIGLTLPRPDYRNFLEELSAHIECLLDCLDEEEEGEE